MRTVDENLYNAACAFLSERFPDQVWQGAAAMYTNTGRILLSTAPECQNDSVSLCHETGALCEAHKINEKVTASLCISKDDKGDIHILTPCGVCQERLFIYGEMVSVAVPDENDSKKWVRKRLKDVQPYYWRKPFLSE
jgi:cytidine deaminase